MVAVIGMDKDKLACLCKDSNVYPVNYNCPGQIVVSGKADDMDKFKEDLKNAEARFIELSVGGSFHTPYMQEASDSLKEELKSKGSYNLVAPVKPLYASKTASPYPDETNEMIDLLSGQISSSVRWEDTLKNMAQNGVDTFIECGPGKTLSGFVKRTVKGARIYNMIDMASLEKIKSELGAGQEISKESQEKEPTYA